MLRIFVTILLMAGAPATLYCQESTRTVGTELASCEANSVELYSFTAKYRSLVTEKPRSRVFVVIRAGSGEGAKTLAHRFNMVTKYLKAWFGNDTNVIYARGENAKGLGRVEMYLGSELALIMLAKRGRVPCMNCCGYDFERGRW